MAITQNEFGSGITLVNIRNTIVQFAILQVFFASNAFSFGFWKSAEFVFEYMLIFFGAWILLLTTLTSSALILCRWFKKPRLAISLAVLFCLPFSWQLWARSIEFDSICHRYIMCIALLPIVYVYFMFGLRRMRTTIGVVSALCIISFIGHADFAASELSKSKTDDSLREIGSLSLDNKPNIHIVMLDSLADSSFTSEFMGIRNPAADLIASLSDAIYAGNLGFSEFVPTKAAWGALFNLGDEGTSDYFTGVKPGRLNVLLRANGYKLSTGFSGDYFGLGKGYWIDSYHVGSREDLSTDLACASDMVNLEFCSAFSRTIFAKLFLDLHEVEDRLVWVHEGNRTN